MGGQTSCLPEGAHSIFTLRDVHKWKGKSFDVDVRSRYHTSGRYPDRLQDKYELQPRLLGCGVTGEVQLARHIRASHMLFAVKTLLKRVWGVEKIKNEVTVFLTLDHPHIARLADVYETEDRIVLVMECLAGGDLQTHVENLNRQKRFFTEEDAADVCRQMFEAVRYLHGQDPPLAHRDVKLDNFMLVSNEKRDLKLIDFGESIWRRDGHTLSGRVGTPVYMAPEVLRQQEHTEKCDIFSLGVTAYIVLTGHPPWSKTVCHPDNRCFEYRNFLRLSHEAKAFLRRLLEIDPARRPSASEALEDPWITGRVKFQANTLDAEVINSMRKYATTTRFKRACLRTVAWSLRHEDVEHLHRCFLEFDRAKNGKICLGDMKLAIANNFSIDVQDAAELFKRLEENCEWSKEEVDYTEFLSLTLLERLHMHQDALHSAFVRLDKDGDGFITPDELQLADISVPDSMFGEAEASGIMEEMGCRDSKKISFQDFKDYLLRAEVFAAATDERLQKVRAQVGKLVDEELASSSGRSVNTFGGFPTMMSFPMTRVDRQVATWGPSP